MAGVQHENDVPVQLENDAPAPDEPPGGEDQDESNAAEQTEAPEEMEDEDECRVCRGPAEEGRPLYAPCKCAGTIGLTHQDCLTSWLSMTRGDGRCELCSTKFHFAPKYAEGAPDRLPPYEVFLGLSRRAVAKWLPFALRFAVATALWLLLVPLITSYLYHGWMHRPSSISTRWKWELIAGDTVSGAVIAAVIIVSFLSLMSFGDFLRFHWNDPVGERQGIGADDAEDGHIAEAEVVVDDELIPVNARDNIVADENEPHPEQNDQPNLVQEDGPLGGGANVLADMPNDPMEQRLELRRRIRAAAVIRRQLDAMEEAEDMERLQEREAIVNEQFQDEANDEDDIPPLLPGAEPDENAADAREDPFARLMGENPGEDVAHGERGNDRQDRLEDMRIPPLRNNERPEPQFAQRDPMMNLDDPGDIDINVALDELLGLRGPFSALIRNLLWLLAFNTTYLGIFAFIPRTVGEAVYGRAVNSTTVTAVIHSIPYMKTNDTENFSLLGALSDLNEESARLNTTLQLPDVSIIVLGYLFMASLVLWWQWGLYLYRRFAPSNAEEDTEQVQQAPPREIDEPVGNRHDVPRAFHERFENLDNAAVAENDEGLGFDRAFFDGAQPPDDDDVVGKVGEKIALAIECSSAVVKVGVLLFLKMLLLPLVLGIWLDAATLDLFDSTGKDRILFAGRDVFGSVLLHWVIGITFMLLVTVSVLQLREVMHPDLLAPVIRPQEPQPDLLGNLLHEKGSTHAKRMVVSLAIYAALLSIHVWLPARLLVSSGIGKYLPFFRPKFWHVAMPQLQVPLELIIFHLCMLAFLEKYKNHIGEMQHHWLAFMCDKMGLTDQILPQSVEKFVLVGTRPVFLETKGEKTSHTAKDDSSDCSAEKKERVPLNGPGTNSSSENPNQVDPFWYELATKKGNVDEFIISNMTVSDSGTTIYEKGRLSRNGTRVLASPQSHIRLPSKPPPLADQKQMQTSGKDEVGQKYLLPTTIGGYRLRKRVQEDGTVVIEFWHEVLGDPIPRPPEGWDDLGVGGAEIQGRWAWGKEKKSMIEESVATRTPFFERDRSRLSSMHLVSKGVLLILLSWLASTVVVCCALSAPLSIGRFVFYLLRVPDRCIHDPLAYALGGSILFPILVTVGSALVARTNTVSFWRRLARWVSAFRWPPIRKLLVMAETAFLWFAVSPLCLGLFYDLVLVKSRSWFSLEEPVADEQSLVLSWGVGTLLLNMWAFLCYVGAFTGNFWVEIGVVLEVQQDRPQGNNGRANEVGGLADPPNPVAGGEGQAGGRWQGGNGRIARFVEIFKAVLLRWEWDRVDGVVLLRETALPVAKHLLASCLGPVTAYVAWLLAVDSRHSASGIVLPLVGVVDKGLYRMIVFRTFAVFSLMVQLASSCQAGLSRWFRAAHKAARDDRYLVGEILMNYVPPDQVRD